MQPLLKTIEASLYEGGKIKHYVNQLKGFLFEHIKLGF